MRGALSPRASRRGVGGRVSFALVCVFSILSFLAAPAAPVRASSPPRTVFVPTTGHTADGLFLDLWRSERPLLGDPITEEFRPRAGFTSIADADVIQFYEHLALVYLPDAEPGFQVQALDLGRQALAEATAAGASASLRDALERSVCSPDSAGECATFPASGHTIRAPFLSYWQEGAGDWLGLPLTESFRAPDGTRVQYFENGILRQTVSAEVEPLPLGRITAKRAKIGTEAIDQPPGVPIYDEALFAIPEAPADSGWSFGPGPQQGGWREIVVSISAQTMWAYEEGQLVMSSLVSTGTGNVEETVTPIGFHSVLSKIDVQTMEGTISGEYYRVEDVPYVMYFDNGGNAIHGTYWHSNFGAPMSHGCINLPMDVAAWMYGWASIGTPVSVVP
jgi:hypothetical protein